MQHVRDWKPWSEPAGEKPKAKAAKAHWADSVMGKLFETEEEVGPRRKRPPPLVKEPVRQATQDWCRQLDNAMHHGLKNIRLSSFKLTTLRLAMLVSLILAGTLTAEVLCAEFGFLGLCMDKASHQWAAVMYLALGEKLRAGARARAGRPMRCLCGRRGVGLDAPVVSSVPLCRRGPQTGVRHLRCPVTPWLVPPTTVGERRGAGCTSAAGPRARGRLRGAGT